MNLSIEAILQMTTSMTGSTAQRVLFYLLLADIIAASQAL
jgi:hypothetical protein